MIIREPLSSMCEFEEALGQPGLTDRLRAEVHGIATLERAHVSGSLVNGFGNLRSDIDVLVLCSKGEDLVTRRSFLLPAERYLEIVSVPDESVATILHDIADREGFDEFWRPRHWRGFSDLELLHRLRISVPLQENGILYPLKDDIAAVLPRYLAVSFYRDACSYWEDMIGALASADAEQAKVMAEFVLSCLAAAAVALVGETTVHGKWLQKKISRALQRPDGLTSRITIARHEAALAIEVNADWEKRVEGLMLDVSIALLPCPQGVPDRPPFQSGCRVERTPRGELRRVRIGDEPG